MACLQYKGFSPHGRRRLRFNGAVYGKQSQLISLLLKHISILSGGKVPDSDTSKHSRLKRALLLIFFVEKPVKSSPTDTCRGMN